MESPRHPDREERGEVSSGAASSSMERLELHFPAFSIERRLSRPTERPHPRPHPLRRPHPWQSQTDLGDGEIRLPDEGPMLTGWRLPRWPPATGILSAMGLDWPLQPKSTESIRTVPPFHPSSIASSSRGLALANLPLPPDPLETLGPPSYNYLYQMSLVRSTSVRPSWIHWFTPAVPLSSPRRQPKHRQSRNTSLHLRSTAGSPSATLCWSGEQSPCRQRTSLPRRYVRCDRRRRVLIVPSCRWPKLWNHGSTGEGNSIGGIDMGIALISRRASTHGYHYYTLSARARPPSYAGRPA